MLGCVWAIRLLPQCEHRGPIDGRSLRGRLLTFNMVTAGSEMDRFQNLVAEAKKNITEISPEAAAVQSKSGAAVLVDVREEEEWNEEHAPGAVHLSRGTIEVEIEEKVPDLNVLIICHCGGGGRSALAAESLQKMGYKNVRSMAGGFKAWKEAGLPTEKD